MKIIDKSWKNINIKINNYFKIYRFNLQIEENIEKYYIILKFEFIFLYISISEII